MCGKSQAGVAGWSMVRGGLAVAVVCCAGWGCSNGEKQEPVYPATGIVRMGGKPFGPCNLTLVPVDKLDGVIRRSVAGTVDKDGKVTFGSYGVNDGAIAGDYKVIVRSSMSAPPPSPIPTKYGSENTTPLTASITADRPNEVVVELQAGKATGSVPGNAFTEATKTEAFRAGAPISTTGGTE